MEKNLFAVVTFPSDGNDEEEIVSEIPSLWLHSNLTQCWWPSVKNINTFIVKRIPVTNDFKWSLHPIQFHGYYDSLDEAREKATNYSSSDDNNMNQIKKNRQNTSSRKQSLKSIVSESESNSDCDGNESILKPPNITDTSVSGNKTSNSLPIANSSFDNIVNLGVLEGTIISHKSIDDLHELITEMSNKVEDHFQRMYAIVTTISLGIQDLNVQLREVEKQQKPVTPDLDITNMERSFPLKSINEVIAFENNLSQNADEYNKFVLYISRIGGRSDKENIIRIYRTLFSNEVAKLSSWKGLRNHFKVSSLNTIIRPA